MTPLLSDQQRKVAVIEFITCCINGKVKITDYTPLVYYLNEKNIKILANLKPSGTKVIQDLGVLKSIPSGLYTVYDARLYLDWLMSVASGSAKESEELEDEASNQLFSLLFVMRDKIQMTKDVQIIAPYDWQSLFTAFDKRLTEMQKVIDKGDKSIIEVLKPLLEFMKKNTKLLETLQKENERVFGKGNPS